MTELTDERTARKTTLTVATVLLLVGAWQAYRLRPVAAAIFLSAAFVLLVIATFAPSLTVAFHRGWMAVAAGLAYVNTRILLTVVFWIVVTPLGLARRLRGYDPLTRRSAKKVSYWLARDGSGQSKKGFERMF